MITEHKTLHKWICSVRPDVVQSSDGINVFHPLPLFVVSAYFLDDEDLFDAYAEAIDDGFGDPIDLDPDDLQQTARLETAILARTQEIIKIREWITIDWFTSWPWYGLRTVTICAAVTPDGDLLALHDPDSIPAFQVIALGSLSDLRHAIAQDPWRFLSRFTGKEVDIRRVIISERDVWTFSDVAGIVDALVGVELREEDVVRVDALKGDANLASTA